MRLFIAEKPSVARAIAGELGIIEKGEGFIRCQNDTITWCFGHMLEQADPDDYTSDEVPRHPKTGKKMWRTEDLPIIPKKWILKPCKEAKKQLSVIGRLLKEATHIVNAGDPDREGQLLIDEVLDHFNCSRPVTRFWVSAQDAVSIQRGLSSLQDNKQYHGFARAAQARSRADWLIGMNFSRAYTLRAQRGGSQALLTVGRVQTPTLALVVERDQKIESFKPTPYFILKAVFKHNQELFPAFWRAKENQAGLDSEGRLIDKAMADRLVETVTGQTGHITEYRQEEKQKIQPRVYALSDITLLASQKFGHSAEEVLKICQSLYETHKLTSYPRTDCSYLPESQHADAPKVLKALGQINPDLADLIARADSSLKSETWDDRKITAHHGIIPTLHTGDITALSDPERRMYDLIVRAYLAQFYPPHTYLSTSVIIDVAGERFEAKGKVVTHNGWCDVYRQASEETEETQVLPMMQTGDVLTCIKATREDAQTKPPARFSEGTLIRAMENIHTVVTDPEHKKLLREGDGIGTSATRAAILSDLKDHGFLALKGKHLISTTLGRSLIAALPEVIRSPTLTALYERTLRAIEQGSSDMDSFIKKQEQFIRDQVAQANNGAIRIEGAKEIPKVSEVHRCPQCGKGLSRRSSSKSGKYFWSCSGYPVCLYICPDLKGQPDFTNQPSTQGDTT